MMEKENTPVRTKSEINDESVDQDIAQLEVRSGPPPLGRCCQSSLLPPTHFCMRRFSG